MLLTPQIGRGQTHQPSNMPLAGDNFGLFHACMSGPLDSADASCMPYDLDRDGDVDMRDFVGLQRGREKNLYLILVAESFLQSPSLGTFVSFRDEAFDVRVVSASSIGTTADEFRAYTRAIAPSYLLLVGRYGDFPPYSIAYPEHTIETYNYYVASSVSGHPAPDIPLGLFLAESEADLGNIVDKTISTDTNISALPRVYYAHAGSQEALPPWPVEFNEELLTEMNDKYFAPDGYTFTLATALDDTPHDVWTDIGMINAGAGFVIYHGHGQINRWSFGLGVGGLPQLDNDVYPIVISAACLTGSFSGEVDGHTAPCFGTRIVASPHGAAAFVGAYGPSGRGQNPLLEGLCEAIHGSEINRLGDALIHGFNNTRLPDTVLTYYPYVTESERARSAWQFHLFGDPAIRIPETTPQTP